MGNLWVTIPMAFWCPFGIDRGVFLVFLSQHKTKHFFYGRLSQGSCRTFTVLQFTHECFLPRVESPPIVLVPATASSLCHWKPPGLLHWPKHEGSWVWVWGLIWFSTHSFLDNTTDAEVTPSLVFSVLSTAGGMTWHIVLVFSSCLCEWCSVFLALHI